MVDNIHTEPGAQSNTTIYINTIFHSTSFSLLPTHTRMRTRTQPHVPMQMKENVQDK